MELREYVSALRRRWVWILVPVLLALGVAAGLTLTAAPAYRSSTILYVTTGTGDPDAKASRLNSYITLLTGPRVAETVIAELKLPMTAEEVQKSITAQVQDGTDLLSVSATADTAERSEAIVTAATTALVGLAKQLDPPPATPDAGPTPSVSIAQDPVTVQDPGNLVRNLAFSAVLGLLIGAAAIAVREATRRTVHSEDDLRRLGIGTVGVIALGGRTGRNGYPDEAIAEAFRRLRSLLPDPAHLTTDSARGTSLLLTGPNPKEGTTAVACGLAIAIAETGARVVLVDANMREPGVGRYLSLDDGPGLSDVLTGAADVHDVLQDSLGGRLTVLASGDRLPDPGEVLASPRLGDTVRELKDRFDVVLVDSPAVHAVADAAVLGKVTDSALLVVRTGHSRTGDISRSVDLLEKVGARMAGAVLNALPRKLPTGTAWHREVSHGTQDGELVASLFGPSPAHDEQADEQVSTEVAPRSPVRGRARVVSAVVLSDHEPSDEDEDEQPERARGMARVVSITDAKLPAPRKSEESPRKSEESKDPDDEPDDQ